MRTILATLALGATLGATLGLGLAGGAQAQAWPSRPVTGFKRVTVYSWQAFAAPEALPVDIKAKLHDAIVAGLNEPAVGTQLLDLGFEIVGNTPEQFTAFQASESARWKKVSEVGKITADCTRDGGPQE